MAATITKYIDIQIPAMEVVMLSATDADTYKSRKFKYVEGAIACINEDTNDSISVCNSDNSPIDGTNDTIRLNGSSLSTTGVILFLFGDKGG